MMVKCPNCSHSGKLSASEEDRPRRIKCPKCGVRFETQTAGIGQKGLADQDAERNGLLDVAIDSGVPTAPEPDEEPIFIPNTDVGELKIDDSGEVILTRSQKSAAPSLYAPTNREPWYYGFLDGWGVFYMVIAALILFSAAGVFIFALSLSGREMTVSLVVAIGIALVASIPVTSAAVIFLVVDAARNIRRQTLVLEQTAKL